VGSCLPDLRSCLQVTLVLRGCVLPVWRVAACFGSAPSLPFLVDGFVFQLLNVGVLTLSKKLNL